MVNLHTFLWLNHVKPAFFHHFPSFFMVLNHVHPGFSLVRPVKPVVSSKNLTRWRFLVLPRGRDFVAPYHIHNLPPTVFHRVFTNIVWKSPGISRVFPVWNSPGRIPFDPQFEALCEIWWGHGGVIFGGSRRSRHPNFGKYLSAKRCSTKEVLNENNRWVQSRNYMPSSLPDLAWEDCACPAEVSFSCSKKLRSFNCCQCIRATAWMPPCPGDGAAAQQAWWV